MADLDSERQDQAKDYARMMRRISFLELGLTAFIALVLLITPQGFTTIMTKLTDQNLSEAQPSR
jgi:hypothetical protein